MKHLPLLEILADGRFHSGEELGRALGVSRAAVWKAVQALRALSLDLHSVKGKGHRLANPVELLRSEALLAALAPPRRAALRGLDLQLSLDSTNAQLLRRLQTGELRLSKGEAFACLAERQTAGRGRRGRAWISPFGRNLYLSLARQFSSGAAGLQGLSLVAGLALRRALRQHGIEGLVLKWPNDLLWRQRKLAGVLLEMTGDLNGECQVVIGVGLNIHSDPADMRELSQPWVDLRGIDSRLPGRNRIAGGVLDALLAALDEFELGGFGAFREEWQAADALRDRRVEVSEGEGAALKVRAGIARGVNERGELLLETGAEMQVVSGGEVSVRNQGVRSQGE